MKKYIGFLGSMLLGAGLMYGLLSTGVLDGLKGYPDSYGWFFIACLPLSYFFVVGLHELGHVAFGLWQDFDFYGLTVGPFSWKRDHGKGIKFAWNKNLNVAGGVAMMLPNGDHSLAKRFAWFAAGGPIFSLLLIL